MLVNTCAVRDNAEQRVIGRVGELQRYKRPGDVLGVVGCMAQRLGPALLEQVPRVDLVVGPDAYRNLPELIGQAPAGQRVTDTEFRSWEHYEDVPPVREPGPTALRHGTARLRLQVHLLHRSVHARPRAEPQAGGRGPRGRASSRTTGTTEVTLLGPDRQQLSRRHARLRRPAPRGRARWTASAGFGSPVRTRPTSRRGSSRRWPTTPAVCEHVHLPVQSGSNAVLRRMLRRYTRERYLEVVAELRAAIPGITFSTDIIVGFPGETEAQFAETLSPGGPRRTSTTPTPSSTRCAKARRRCGSATTCRTTSRRSGSSGSSRTCAPGTRRRNAGRVGKVHEVLVERPARRGDLMLARTRTNLLVAAGPLPRQHRRVPHGAAHRHHRIHLHRRGRRPQLAVL